LLTSLLWSWLFAGRQFDSAVIAASGLEWCGIAAEKIRNCLLIASIRVDSSFSLRRKSLDRRGVSVLQTMTTRSNKCGQSALGLTAMSVWNLVF
jgi:hypothetical protein